MSAQKKPAKSRKTGHGRPVSNKPERLLPSEELREAIIDAATLIAAGSAEAAGKGMAEVLTRRDGDLPLWAVQARLEGCGLGRKLEPALRQASVRLGRALGGGLELNERRRTLRAQTIVDLFLREGR